MPVAASESSTCPVQGRAFLYSAAEVARRWRWRRHLYPTRSIAASPRCPELDGAHPGQDLVQPRQVGPRHVAHVSDAVDQHANRLRVVRIRRLRHEIDARLGTVEHVGLRTESHAHDREDIVTHVCVCASGRGLHVAIVYFFHCVPTQFSSAATGGAVGSTEQEN